MASLHFPSIRELHRRSLQLQHLLADNIVRLACHHRVVG